MEYDLSCFHNCHTNPVNDTHSTTDHSLLHVLFYNTANQQCMQQTTSRPKFKTTLPFIIVSLKLQQQHRPLATNTTIMQCNNAAYCQQTESGLICFSSTDKWGYLHIWQVPCLKPLFYHNLQHLQRLTQDIQRCSKLFMTVKIRSPRLFAAHNNFIITTIGVGTCMYSIIRTLNNV